MQSGGNLDTAGIADHDFAVVVLDAMATIYKAVHGVNKRYPNLMLGERAALTELQRVLRENGRQLRTAIVGRFGVRGVRGVVCVDFRTAFDNGKAEVQHARTAASMSAAYSAIRGVCVENADDQTHAALCGQLRRELAAFMTRDLVLLCAAAIAQGFTGPPLCACCRRALTSGGTAHRQHGRRRSLFVP